MARVAKSLPSPASALEPLLGRRADDRELRRTLEPLGIRVPLTTSEATPEVSVASKKRGSKVGCGFGHRVALAAYPAIQAKKKGRYTPYLTSLQFPPEVELGGSLGLGRRHTLEEVTKRLGAPRLRAGDFAQWWHVPIDLKRQTIIRVEHNDLDDMFYSLGLDDEGVLVSPVPEPGMLPIHGLFLAWLVQRDLLDLARIPAPDGLVEAVRARTLRGSELLTQGFPDGLWVAHLRDDPALRGEALNWVMGGFLEPMTEVFGTSTNPTVGLMNPGPGSDTWKAYDRAAPSLDAAFARWIPTKKPGRRPRRST